MNYDSSLTVATCDACGDFGCDGNCEDYLPCVDCEDAFHAGELIAGRCESCHVAAGEAQDEYDAERYYGGNTWP